MIFIKALALTAAIALTTPQVHAQESDARRAFCDAVRAAVPIVETHAAMNDGYEDKHYVGRIMYRAVEQLQARRQNLTKGEAANEIMTMLRLNPDLGRAHNVLEYSTACAHQKN